MQYWFYAFFLSFRDGLVESYAELFGAGGESDYSSSAVFGKKWGWYQSIFSLAKGDITRLEDITKLNVHTCLYALSYMKDQAELEAKQIKKNMKK